MRVLLSTWGSRGDVEPLLGLALELRTQGVDVRMCAPPDFADRLAEVGVPLVPMGFAERELVASRPSPAEVAAALVAQHFEVVGKAAEDCDAVVASGLMPAGVGFRGRAPRHPLRARRLALGRAAVTAAPAGATAGEAVPAGCWSAEAGRTSH